MLAPLPPQRDLQKAADILNQGNRGSLSWAGRGALGCRAELEQVAGPPGRSHRQNRCWARDLSQTKAHLPRAGLVCWETVHLPRGRHGVPVDTLLIVGVPVFPYEAFYPKPDQARAIQIDIDPSRIGLRLPCLTSGCLGFRGTSLPPSYLQSSAKQDRSFLEKGPEGG